MKKQRNAEFDIAKCIAMFLVVQGHLLSMHIGDPAFMINSLHMPALFFISGYLAFFSMERRSAGEVLKKKVTALLIPYVIWSAISLLANAALTVLGGIFTVSAFLTEAVQIFVYARSVWFLIQLFVTFAVFLGIHALLKKTNMVRYEPVVYAVVWLAVICLVPGDLFAFQKFKWLFPFFYAGYVCCKNRECVQNFFETKPKRKMIGWFSFAFPVLALVFLKDAFFWSYTEGAYADIVSVLVGLCYYAISTAGVIFLLKISNLISKRKFGIVCAEIGTYSMDIYLIHMFLIKFIPMPIDLNSTSPFVAHGILAVLSLAVVLIIWVMCKFVLRKIGLYRFCVGMK